MSVQTPTKKLNAMSLANCRGATPIVGLTAYTAPMAAAMDQHVDFILVGDSLAMTIYGESSTVGVDLDTMIRHGRAVVRACRHACVVVEMPFGSYQASPEQVFHSAARILMETGCDAVKLGGGAEMAETAAFLVQRGIPVMGHIGLTPQSINTLGGFKTQGKDGAAVAKLVADRKAIDQAGCFSIVIESVMEAAARQVIDATGATTIGIGASRAWDGQILIIDDIIGLFVAFKPKLVKRCASVLSHIEAAIETVARGVRERKYPSGEYLFGAGR
ncbi:3-methyl-2-oxobutanoate hydroxymethyltransferase [Tianweitania sediminis]|uniref:3-methyl-2-oxobutanoate hydroxymethyltransferase n=1 Tax=Tianweitania sediminis TaxID=1502156 RepID=A0A8J7RK82_9HYPH|nr:3-methyl-2-oxobutanoate hydroxymethyltransferase [Tianweitania sediminis]MBP0439976.1 3-methyl-2-oxobutanoate hydroxymethyltransferase [Tianweitania sediminis]